MSRDVNLELQRLCIEMAQGASPESRRVLEAMAADFAARATAPPHSNLPWYVTGIASLVFVYSIWALHLSQIYHDITPKGEIVVQLIPPLEQYDNAAISRLRRLKLKLANYGDDANIESDKRSPILLYENDKVLGPAHSTFKDIRELGAGRYAHFNTGEIIFSASDNTDPISNGRSYFAVKP